MNTPVPFFSTAVPYNWYWSLIYMVLEFNIYGIAVSVILYWKVILMYVWFSI